MPKGKLVKKREAKLQQAESYQHPESTNLMRPDVGTQPQFKRKKPPVTYRYDSSLSPALDWDGQNPAREVGDRHLSVVLSQLSAARGSLSSLQSRLPDVLKKETTNDWQRTTDALKKAQGAAQSLKAMTKPFLNWAGKAERLSFDVPTLPLFVHERLSTKAIIETLSSHKRDKQQTLFDLFGDPEHSITDQVLRAYEHRDQWVNRMILGDSLVVMNSLLQYEGLGGQVQMIYMDPPYGVKFGSNFQPFVRKRDVTHNDDDNMTREPEMVQAYRDTWELGLHSYLTYLRDRLLLARDLLAPSGSIFIQISDENFHHLREVMDEVFGPGQLCGVVTFAKTTGATSDLLPTTTDFLLWYARERDRVKYRQLYVEKLFGGDGTSAYSRVRVPEGTTRALTSDEKAHPSLLPEGARIYRIDNLTSQRPPGDFPVEFKGRTYRPRRGYWKTGEEGMAKLRAAGRLESTEDGLYYVRYIDDFPVFPLSNSWTDTTIAGFASDKLYVVQTSPKVVQRCILMTTDPGDLVLDPTCGSGTTAYVAEQWGRRWITIDTSRVPLALARQRLLTATFPWYELKDEARGPVAGFVYKRRQNNKGEEVGGIVPHITLKSIANNEPPEEEVLVDRPEKDDHITRVSGPFCVEATIPTPVPADAGDDKLQTADSRKEQSTYVDRMLEVLRKSPVLHLAGNRTVMLKNIRPPAKTLSLSAEALVDATALNGATLADAVQEAREKNGLALPLSQKPVALVFGPENGAVATQLVENAAHEAAGKNYAHLFVIGFAIEAKAHEAIDNCEAVFGIPATYVSASPDLIMSDLLKNMRSSQIFSVCGLPEIKIHKVGRQTATSQTAASAELQIQDSKFQKHDHAESQIAGSKFLNGQYQVELLGLDVFDPITMENVHRNGNDVPAWFLDTDYNGLCFHVSQAFFPRTSAWDSLKKALKGEYEESVWDHLAGTKSAPFEAGEHRQIAVKVIDDRGNELMVVEKLA